MNKCVASQGRGLFLLHLETDFTLPLLSSVDKQELLALRAHLTTFLPIPSVFTRRKSNILAPHLRGMCYVMFELSLICFCCGL